MTSDHAATRILHLLKREPGILTHDEENDLRTVLAENKQLRAQCDEAHGDLDTATAELARAAKREEFLDSSLDAMRQQAVEAVKARNAATARAELAEAELAQLHTAAPEYRIGADSEDDSASWPYLQHLPCQQDLWYGSNAEGTGLDLATLLTLIAAHRCPKAARTEPYPTVQPPAPNPAGEPTTAQADRRRCGDLTQSAFDDRVLACTRPPHPGDPWHADGNGAQWAWKTPIQWAWITPAANTTDDTTTTREAAP